MAFLCLAYYQTLLWNFLRPSFFHRLQYMIFYDFHVSSTDFNLIPVCFLGTFMSHVLKFSFHQYNFTLKVMTFGDMTTFTIIRAFNDRKIKEIELCRFQMNDFSSLFPLTCFHFYLKSSFSFVFKIFPLLCGTQIKQINQTFITTSKTCSRVPSDL